jgi:hypothetical protein
MTLDTGVMYREMEIVGSLLRASIIRVLSSCPPWQDQGQSWSPPASP